MRIFIDNTEVTEDEYLQRVEIFDEGDSGFCDEFLDLFAALGVEICDRDGNMTPIEDLTEQLSEAYLNWVDFCDTENIHGYVN